jgi:hypothetical protein
LPDKNFKPCVQLKQLFTVAFAGGYSKRFEGNDLYPGVTQTH